MKAGCGWAIGPRSIRGWGGWASGAGGPKHHLPAGAHISPIDSARANSTSAATSGEALSFFNARRKTRLA
jgi:hypothetical protein